METNKQRPTVRSSKMRKNGKKIFGFCSKVLSPLVSPYSNSSSPTSETASVVALPRHGFSELMVQQTLQAAAEIIRKWSTESLAYAQVASMFDESKEEALRFIQCVSDLQKVMYFLPSEKLLFSHSLMQIAMKRLQIEFYWILSVKREPLYAQSIAIRSHGEGNSISEVRTVSSVAMMDLRTIAECMISSGYTKECVEIYRTVRKSIVDEGIYRLGMVQLSSHIRKMDFEAVDFRIKKWLEAVNTAITTLFMAERVLCDRIFEASESVRESSFTKTCKDGALLLFAFPEIVVKSKKLQKNMFCMLDMFTTIFENWPRIESIFSFESSEVVRSQAFTSLSILAESISAMLSDFESSIRNDSSNSISTYDGIHTLALQSMDYLSLLAEYREILFIIFAQWPPSGKSSFQADSRSNTSVDDCPVSVVKSYMERLIFILLCKLDSRARQSDDISLSYLFLANNVQHVVSKVHRSKLHHLLGDEWIARHKTKVKQYIDSYTRLAWGKVISSLPENPTATLSTAKVAEVYDIFNSTFKEAYRKQRSSIVPDPKLRDEIKLWIAESWLPVYREFYHGHRFPVGQEVIARLTPEDVENYLSYLFFPPIPVPAESNSLTNQQNTNTYG